MSEESVYPVPASYAEKSLLNEEAYFELYNRSIEDNEAFWREQGQRLDWMKPYTQVKDVSFAKEDLHIRWYADGTLNVSANCLDRHLAERGDETAILWVGDEPGVSKEISYRQLHRDVCRFANGLKSLGVQKGDVVTIYLPMIPEAAVAMLACARIGAIHSVVFAGFSPESLAGRMDDGKSRVVITANAGKRGGRTVPLKENVDKAVELCSETAVEKVVVINYTGDQTIWHDGRDCDYAELVDKQSEDCPAEEMQAEDPLFILYTSGSTGKPKGVLHSSGGYLTYTSLTHEYVFDYRKGERYWCAADIGWVTGHSYIIYGPLANGATTVMYEGVPNYPDVTRVAQIIDEHQINILYIAPTAIRALMAAGDKPTSGASLESLRLLGTVGEPINPEAWRWYYNSFGRGRCPIVDTWWQTETGGAMLTPLPGATPLKPGSATRPFFGIRPALVDNEGKILDGATEGNLVILDSWPGQMRTVFGDHQRFIDTYFSTFEGMYFSGDGARRDEDGYYWITGRVDDVLNVSGHRMGTAELESALVAHEAVAEAAVVGYPHDIKGQGIYVYVTLNCDREPSEEMRQQLRNWLRSEIGPIATPDVIQWAPGLPKTRSGKIMRRILRKIAADECDQLGDISTLADPSVVQQLIDGRESLAQTA
ncbi:acetate--CoA ligase [Microbulbifer thermotolerans]|uniref:Acetyl-coenzyme A synthetase n=1 Tax=Microbulbifer thermotolerans TaxID=252514 RepID=A0A143HKA0_MICTH|nr:acetate--CoA ligase [Microbulbifer thermotolerans]AMX01916.1 acetyl-coenzyme A synthetase [Microbulbifer thermotolerans]MCX2835417.1 acetate--CoA ligase [Microbulbifer thermotolerans]SFB67078.1 acetyl-coenzyme A synthetase [Microbulbifer thermotolerans]